MLLDQMAQHHSAPWRSEKKWRCDMAKADTIWLQKPQTFMNDSGRAVAAALSFYRLKPQEMLVVYDDVDLPLGKIKLRPGGSAGGHNGIKSIIASTGTDQFPRLKIGIAAEQGRPDGDKLADFVLATFTEDERAHLAQVLDRAEQAVQHSLQAGIDSAMNLFNRNNN
jgi:peptidyl-tRNA hydrolase, PTH1 family